MVNRQPREYVLPVGLRCSGLARVKADIISIRITEEAGYSIKRVSGLFANYALIV